MTLPRYLVIACSILLLFQHLNGQDAENPNEATHLVGGQSLGIISEAADSSNSQPLIPNVFTPNGDGINDFIEVPGDGIRVFEFSVFTRTGTRVYLSNSPRIFWDGTNSSGMELKEGVYYYVLEEEEDSGPYVSAGFIYLFR